MVAPIRVQYIPDPIGICEHCSRPVYDNGGEFVVDGEYEFPFHRKCYDELKGRDELRPSTSDS